MAGSNEEVLRAVFSAWGESIDAAVAATMENFATDCVWEQTGMPTTCLLYTSPSPRDS